MRPQFSVTFEIVTPESASRGDTAGGGFLDADAQRSSFRTTVTLRQALRLLGHLEDSGSWFTEADGRQNFRTGAEERRSLHPPARVTAASYDRLRDLLLGVG